VKLGLSLFMTRFKLIIMQRVNMAVYPKNFFDLGLLKVTFQFIPLQRNGLAAIPNFILFLCREMAWLPFQKLKHFQ
jgi:hypothetical protein